MIPLARAILFYEWRRFFPAVLAVAFAGILIVAQAGLLLGVFKTITVYIDRSSADLWVGYPGTPSVDQPRPIPERIENTLRMHPAVRNVERFTWTIGEWRRPEGGSLTAVLIGVDPRAHAMTFEYLLTPQLKQKLQTPGNVLVEESELSKLGVQVGDYTELSGKRVFVAGTVRGIRSVGFTNVISSLYTARSIDSNLLNNYIDYFLVKLQNPQQANQVRDQLQPTGTFQPYEVWTASQLTWKTMIYWLFESGNGSSFLFSSAIALLVGIMVTSQTLRASVMATLREYATLRALGVSTGSLRAVVLEQSLWIGVAGLLITLLISVLFSVLATIFYVSFYMPWFILLAILFVVILVTLLSGLSVLNTLKRAEPFSLLR